MIKDFQAKQLEIQTKTMMGEQMGPEDMASVQQLYAIMARDPLAAQYLAGILCYYVQRVVIGL